MRSQRSDGEYDLEGKPVAEVSDIGRELLFIADRPPGVALLCLDDYQIVRRASAVDDDLGGKVGLLVVP